ncbi:hypothetical protein AVEN_83210-1 [Araneus ventricosus]|uniref:Uncharacterized protein n=1 Tax=Araneus ventricosus TaxID=182803 RepID=A0A4Y2AQ69_ARAVE|nr:hypothetical protein AVEN_83210-1 [Araneus ventricosus]
MGNQRTDDLAKLATSKEEIDCKVRLKTCLDLVCWDATDKGQWTKKFFRKVKLKRILGDFYLNEICTRHEVFQIHQELLFGKTSNCFSLLAEGTVEHVMLE